MRLEAGRIEEAIKAGITEGREEWARKGKVYPSDLGGEGCRLAYWRRLRDFPQDTPTPGTLLMFEMGNAAEASVAKALAKGLKQYGWELVDEQTSIEFGGLTGRLDFLLREAETGNVAVIECKSKRGNAFKFLPEPKPNNEKQGQFAMAAVDADQGFIVYADREGQNFVRVFEIQRDDAAVLEAVKERVDLRDGDEPEPLKLLVQVSENKGPDSVYLKVPWQVGWCNDAGCPCKKAMGKVPSGVVAKIKKPSGEVVATEGNERYLPLVKELLKGVK